MNDTLRAVVGFGAALGAFAMLCGCGQRGPLTLPESERPVRPLDKGAAPAPVPAPTAPAGGAPGAQGAPAEAPQPEDDERRNKE